MILTSALGGEEGTGHQLHFLDEEAAMLRVTQGVQTGRSVSQLLVLPKSLALSCSPQQIKEQQTVKGSAENTSCVPLGRCSSGTREDGEHPSHSGSVP